MLDLRTQIAAPKAICSTPIITMPEPFALHPINQNSIAMMAEIIKSSDLVIVYGNKTIRFDDGTMYFDGPYNDDSILQVLSYEYDFSNGRHYFWGKDFYDDEFGMWVDDAHSFVIIPYYAPQNITRHKP